MFCIKCGMLLDNSAKSCPACGTKVVFPEGFSPDDSPSPAPKAEVVISSEPPHAPDDFDLSKANITYNGKTMLINDEPEVDLDSTMAAPIPRAAQTVNAPSYQQPVYQAPSSYIPSPAPSAHTEESEAVTETKKSKSKMPLVIGISIVVLIVALVAIFSLTGKDKNGKETSPSSPSVSSVSKVENLSVTTPDNNTIGDSETVLVEYGTAPAEGLVYIIREKDSQSVDFSAAVIGYLLSDPVAIDFIMANEKAAKEFKSFGSAAELKAALEKGDVSVILISDEFSYQIISQKSDSTETNEPNLTSPDDNDFDPVGEDFEQQESEAETEENAVSSTAATVTNSKPPAEAISDTASTAIAD